jgi:hypothetical protein
MSTEEELLNELKAIKLMQNRIDAVYADFNSETNRFASISACSLGELLGLDFDDTADWGRSFLAYPRDEDDEVDPDEGPSPDVIHISTSVEASCGGELEFEGLVGDGGEASDVCSPYDLINGLGIDLNEYIECPD